MSTTQSTAGLEPLEKIAVGYENNKKRINTIVTVILGAVIAFFGYKYFIQAPEEEKAGIAMSHAEQMFSIDSVNVALNGDVQGAGFLTIIKKYGSTASGNVAQYYAGACYLKMGDYKSAIKHLEAFNPKGTILATAKSGLLGDAYMESNDLKKGIEQYKAATSDADDDVYAPIYLQRLAIAYEKNNQIDEAAKALKRIRDDYPRSFQSRDVEKSLAQLGVLD